MSLRSLLSVVGVVLSFWISGSKTPKQSVLLTRSPVNGTVMLQKTPHVDKHFSLQHVRLFATSVIDPKTATRLDPSKPRVLMAVDTKTPTRAQRGHIL